MQKIALLLLVSAVAAMPAAAIAKKKTKKMVHATAQKIDPNEASWRFVKNGLPLILPTWALPIYFHMHDKDMKKKKH